MLARAHAFTIDGLHTRRITVEVDIRAGLPAFTIVGLADTAVREARERIQAAIRNAGFDFPARRITANLAPGDVPKAGPGLDLALACAVLAASGQLDGAMLGRAVMLGELSLDGRVRPSRGSLAVAEATHRAGLELLALAGASAREAGLIDGLRVTPVESLRSAVRVLEGGPPDPLPAPAAHPGAPRPADRCPELSDVIGQPGAVQALVVAAAGGHNCLLSGAPGTGKTMLAQRLGSILPPMSRREAIEVTRIRGLLGTPVTGLASERPFRAPHHSITAAGLIGGVRGGWAGEVLLAHNGVLFLDELSEFSRPTLDALRQPLEDGRVAVVRSRHSAVYPTRFMLMAATNPCPCGYAGEGEDCSCSPGDVARHERRLSGPLLDRIDLLVEVHRPRVSSASEEGRTTSAQARELVREARARGARRLKIDGLELNAQMDASALRSHVHLDSRAEALLGMAREQGALSCRGEARVMSVARTIADVEASSRVRARDVGAALTLRGRRGRAVRHAA